MSIKLAPVTVICTKAQILSSPFTKICVVPVGVTSPVWNHSYTEEMTVFVEVPEVGII